MENEFKKISSAVPKESDFFDVIISVKKQRPTCVNADDDSVAMEGCSYNVSSVMTRFYRMFFKVYDEFPDESRIDPLYGDILHQRFNYDDCDSLGKCESLKRSALACMLVVVRRCVPCMAFLDKVREYMANLDDCVVGEHASAAATAKYNLDEGSPVPQPGEHEFAETIEHLVDPQTLVWLEELDRVPSAVS
ncbi:nucleolar GTP-binding protein 1 isoform X2 [Raphanus sativus]|uniref:Nucleolar GTP-binding protein 1 isoform X2 n=1 Tax=Raphanus sativus TaxID=3726 RepID=A0A6J0LKR4_RAPSA|nr:nucleolar GTP-binding protein 1 isoform X2 [Raphanus sativus]